MDQRITLQKPPYGGQNHKNIKESIGKDYTQDPTKRPKKLIALEQLPHPRPSSFLPTHWTSFLLSPLLLLRSRGLHPPWAHPAPSRSPMPLPLVPFIRLHGASLLPDPLTPVLRHAAVHVHTYRVCVCVSLHDGQLLCGTFVAFDRVMNTALRDCVELYHPSTSVHPHEGHHATGLFVFRRAEIVSMTIEALQSSPLMLAISMLATDGPNSTLGGSVGVPPVSLLVHHVIATHSYSHRLG
jgi:small nuclear ribonucleoprotein (snRNP)-like protein